MPTVNVGKWREEKFKFETPEELEIIRRAKNNFCDSNHDVYDFVLYFFGRRSSDPSHYLSHIKEGSIAISIESWNKIKVYVSTLESE